MMMFTMEAMEEKAKSRNHGGARQRAGRNPKHAEGKTEKVNLNIPPALVEKLDKIAAKEDCSRSEMATEAIRQLIAKKLPKRKRAKRPAKK